jgi:hypothetical protein
MEIRFRPEQIVYWAKEAGLVACPEGILDLFGITPSRVAMIEQRATTERAQAEQRAQLAGSGMRNGIRLE